MKYFFTLLVLSATTIAAIHANELTINEATDLVEQSNILNENSYGDNDVYEFNLKNGMRVLIKPCSNGCDEIHLQVVASGGYGSLSPVYFPSAKLLGKIIVESGLGPYSSKELATLFYKDAVEMEVSVENNYRIISGTAHVEQLNTLLQLINYTFTDKKITVAATKNVVRYKKEKFRANELDLEKSFEQRNINLNTGNSPLFAPLNYKLLSKVKYAKALEVYNRAFSDPKEFTVIIVGNLNIPAIKNVIERYLGSIPAAELSGSSEPNLAFKIVNEIAFPQGIKTEKVSVTSASKGLTFLTIPFFTELNAQNFLLVKGLTYVLTNRIKAAFKGENWDIDSLNVGYDIALYPSTSKLWFRVKYLRGSISSEESQQLIAREFMRIKDDGITEAELVAMRQYMSKKMAVKVKEADYWEEMLANFALWGWDIKSLPNPREPIPLQLSEVNEILQRGIVPGNYTSISSSAAKDR